jgi:cardiolipin synthase A/B
METAARGVRIRVIVPGRRTHQRVVRLASRRLYGPLLEAGLRIHEYQPGMTHATALMINGRSFEHNDEINVAFREREVMTRLTRDFEADLGQREEVTYERWRRRPLLEKALKPLTWLLERQQ